MPRSKSASPSLLEEEEDCLDKDFLVTSLKLVLKTQDSQVYKCHDVALLGLKSGRAQYEEGKRGRKNEKDKRDRENERGKRGEEGHCRNKVNLMVEKSSDFEASVYYHIIYQCYQRLMILR